MTPELQEISDCQLCICIYWYLGYQALSAGALRVLSEFDEQTIWSHLRTLTLFYTALGCSIWAMFFLIPAYTCCILYAVIQRVQNLGLFTSAVCSYDTAVHCNIKQKFSEQLGEQLQIAIDVSSYSQKLNFSVESDLLQGMHCKLPLSLMTLQIV